MERSTQHAFEAEEIMAYLDGELEAKRAATLAAHLEHCAECQEVAQGFRALSERMLGFEVEPYRAAASEAVLNRVSAAGTAEMTQPKKRKFKIPGWRNWPVKPLVWGLAGAVICALVLVIGLPRTRRTDANSDYKSWLEKSNTFAQQNELSVASSRERSSSLESMAREQDVPRESMQLAMRAEPGAQPVAPPPAPPASSSDDDALKAPEAVGPMIVQTAALSIVATNYDEASGAIEKLAAAHGGYVEKLTAKAQTGNARELSVALRIPAKQLDGFLADLRKLGHVEEESRSNEEVSAQYVDLQARTRSARATEQRLIELLGTRTGKLEDVLDAERELARIRGEIESMQGQSAVLVHQVNYATVQVELSEEYREQLRSTSTSTGTRVWNSAVDGFKNLEDGVISALVLVLDVGPSLLFWLAVLLVPAWVIWRRFRPRVQS
jgi:hypothetical protein